MEKVDGEREKRVEERNACCRHRVGLRSMLRFPLMLLMVRSGENDDGPSSLLLFPLFLRILRMRLRLRGMERRTSRHSLILTLEVEEDRRGLGTLWREEVRGFDSGASAHMYIWRQGKGLERNGKELRNDEENF